MGNPVSGLIMRYIALGKQTKYVDLRSLKKLPYRGTAKRRIRFREPQVRFVPGNIGIC